MTQPDVPEPMPDAPPAPLERMPVVAILRGVRPDEVVDIGQTLVSAGIRCIEVPLNSPAAIESIERLAARLPEGCLIGAGTVLHPRSVDEVIDRGGRLIVAPNTDRKVIRRALRKGGIVMPGVATATEAFDAYRWGARLLKLFPASTYGAGHLRSLRAVVPRDCRLYAVGGIPIAGLHEWLEAGAAGFGVGSELYRPGDSAEAVAGRAATIVSELRGFASSPLRQSHGANLAQDPGS